MNILRQKARLSLRRTYRTAAPYVPPASTRDMDDHESKLKPKPESPTFYTARPNFYDSVVSLEKAIQYARQALTAYHLLPLPDFARASLPPRQPVWKGKIEMKSTISATLTTARYRRLTTLLNQLHDYQRIADTAGHRDLGAGIFDVVRMFERDNKEAFLAAGKRKPVKFDQYGRSYTIGRRKTSTARVWIIPVKTTSPAPTRAAAVEEEVKPKPESLHVRSLREDLFGSSSESESLFNSYTPEPTVNVTPSTILVNNRALSDYFPVPGDREKIVRPLKIAGLLGAYNVFAIVRGGGTTGQSGAVALGIAKGLAAHDPQVQPILRKAKLLRRDPRMVERKKTGLAKARKRYAWVKR